MVLNLVTTASLFSFLVSSTLAFVPPSATFVKSSGYAVQTSTTLPMNLMDRFVRVAKSNINNVIVKMEDPEKVMSQALVDMQNDLIRVRQSYAEVTASQRRLVKQQLQADALANDWYNRAQLALRRNNEGLAREALVRREMELDNVRTLQKQIDAQVGALDKLYSGMQELERKIVECHAKKEQLAARARTAKTTKQVNDMLAGMTDRVLSSIASSTSTAAFKRMEEKVEALEAAAEASAEIRVFDMKVLPESRNINTEASLENEFKRLEQSAAVDLELQKLKGLLSPRADASNRTYIGLQGLPF